MGCGFYGDPLRNDMCSLCYNKHKSDANQPTEAATAADEKRMPAPVAAVSAATRASASETPAAATAFATAPSTDAEAAAAAAAASSPAGPGNTESAGNPLSQPVQAMRKPVEGGEGTASPSAMSSSAPCSIISPPSPLASSVGGSGASTPSRRPPKKGRCNQCNARVALVKQTTNRCRCDYVFCDTHRFPDQHDCKFDFKESDRKDLEKNNPKLNVKPKGGRSFTRID
ncbi:hypothetical protein EV179_004128 [Coemansia sp. RSA 487]|nr:hypothetical protein EV179_004128 [Coemansia sp. RSA 487]